MTFKPEWKDAPEWAMWLAQDEVGLHGIDHYWVWFEREPETFSNGWADYSLDGRWHETRNVATVANWKKTLEPRP